MNQLQDQTQMKLRLPRDLHSWLEQRAKANERSQTGEVNFILQQVRKAALAEAKESK